MTFTQSYAKEAPDEDSWIAIKSGNPYSGFQIFSLAKLNPSILGGRAPGAWDFEGLQSVSQKAFGRVNYYHGEATDVSEMGWIGAIGEKQIGNRTAYAGAYGG